MALKMASTGPSPGAVADHRLAVDSSSRSAFCGPLEPATTCSETKRMRSLLRTHLVVDQGHDVLVEDVLLLVGQILEAVERVVDRVVAELEAQLLAASS